MHMYFTQRAILKSEKQVIRALKTWCCRCTVQVYLGRQWDASTLRGFQKAVQNLGSFLEGAIGVQEGVSGWHW